MLILSVQNNDGNVTLKGSGCGKVSKNYENYENFENYENYEKFANLAKHEIYCFDLESAKEKILKCRINVSKWLKSLSKWISSGGLFTNVEASRCWKGIDQIGRVGRIGRIGRGVGEGGDRTPKNCQISPHSGVLILTLLEYLSREVKNPIPAAIKVSSVVIAFVLFSNLLFSAQANNKLERSRGDILKNGATKFFISCAIMLSLTIYLSLLCKMWNQILDLQEQKIHHCRL